MAVIGKGSGSTHFRNAGVCGTEGSPDIVPEAVEAYAGTPKTPRPSTAALRMAPAMRNLLRPTIVSSFRSPHLALQGYRAESRNVSTARRTFRESYPLSRFAERRANIKAER